MLISPSPLGGRTLTRETLSADLKSSRRFGSCAVGSQALYLGGRFFARSYYLPWKEIKRVFKRVAMSKGGFSGRGVFGSMAFLVVQFGSGQERECPFKMETDADKLLAAVEREHPEIPTHSVKAANRLARAEAAEEARFLKELPAEAEQTVARLREDRAFLEEYESLSRMLTASARQKRVADNLSPAYRAAGAVLGVAGLLAAAFGVWGLIAHWKFAMFYILGGGALFFLTLSSNTFPSKWNSRQYAQKDWDETVAKMQGYLKGRPAFSVPARYAHPVVLDRMIRVVREGRAVSAEEALQVVKDDLRALNSSVTVTQKEHDEVVEVKPLFLVCGYE